MRKLLIFILIIYLYPTFVLSRTKNGEWDSISYSGYNNSYIDDYLDLNLYEADSNSCKNIDPSTSSTCYFSIKVKPKIEKWKFSGFLPIKGFAQKNEFKIKLLDQEYELTYGGAINLQYLGITGEEGNTYVDGKQFPAVGIDLWLYDNKAFNLFGIKPAITANYTTTPYSPFYIVGKNSSGTEKWIRGNAQFTELRAGVSLRIGGASGRDKYRFFQFDYESILQSKLKFEGKTNNIKGTVISITWLTINY